MNYLRLCFKRCLKALPAVFAVTAAVVLTVALAVSALVATSGQDELPKTRVGLVGDLEGTYFDIGIYALENLDSSADYVSFSMHERAEAERMLLAGELDGYLFIPDGFVSAIIKREPVPLKYVVRSEPSGLGTALVAEVVDIAAQMVGETQNGIYGMQEYVYKTQKGVGSLYKQVEQINLKYVTNALDRALWVDVQTVNVAGAPDMASYYGYSALTVLLMLWGIAAFGLLKRRPVDFSRFAASKGVSVQSQCAAEYFAFFVITLMIFLPIALGLKLILSGSIDVVFILLALCAVFAISATEFLVYRAFEKTVSVILFWFTLTLFSCYTAGCFYPSWFFPEAVRAVGALSPAGAVFEAMKSGGAGELEGVLICLIYGAVSIALAVLFSKRRVSR